VVYGYPVGGDEISTTKGIVSRIEHQNYSHGFMDHLTIQIDAPINSGNSGGPAFDQNGKIVGIAIQTITRADGIGYLVPVEVIEHFFDDIKDGVYDGYPDDGMYIQALQNKNIKAFYNMENREGVLVTSITKSSSSEGYIKKGDVILEVDGVDIAGDNTIKLKGNGRVSSNYLVRVHQVGDEINIKVLRDNKEIHVNFPLKSLDSIIPIEHEIEPRFYIFGGMVFMPLTVNYLKVWGANWYSKAPINLIHLVMNKNKIDKEIDELVILSNLLPNDENANYSLDREVVVEVNGQKVISLDSFVKIIEESKDQYINILLDSGRKYILNKEKALKSDIETMKKYGITKKQRL
jgi:S1-C subfamily serine protease